MFLQPNVKYANFHICLSMAYVLNVNSTVPIQQVMGASNSAMTDTYTTMPLKDAFYVKALLTTALRALIQTLAKDATPIATSMILDAGLFVLLDFILLKLFLDRFAWNALKTVQPVLWVNVLLVKLDSFYIRDHA